MTRSKVSVDFITGYVDMELDTGRDAVSSRMSDAHSHIRHLKHRWDLEDSARDKLEREARQAFLEQEANQLFAPIETYLSKLDKILQAAKALVEIDPTWKHLGDQRLRPISKTDVWSIGTTLAS